MSCFSKCIGCRHKKVRRSSSNKIQADLNTSPNSPHSSSSSSRTGKGKETFQETASASENGKRKLQSASRENGESSGKPKTAAACSFTFQELAAATGNFRPVNVIGEGGFGKVYRGALENGQVVAVKQLNPDGVQGFQQFVVEVLMLCMLHHPNLVTLIGYCTNGDQRLLVYEYMPMGSLEDHLFDLEPGKQPLDWVTRMRIAAGAARGLQYLHCKADPPVIYRDLKSANILLDMDFNPKLSDFGIAKLGPVGDNTHVSTRVMGTYGYCAPEYAMSGKLTLKSDIYSFGVVLLELITGCKALDLSRKAGQQNLVTWAYPYLKDRRRFVQIVDPLLRGAFPSRALHHAVAVAAMCLQEQPIFRPIIGDIVEALDYVLSESEKAELKKKPASHSRISSAE